MIQLYERHAIVPNTCCVRGINATCATGVLALTLKLTIALYLDCGLVLDLDLNLTLTSPHPLLSVSCRIPRATTPLRPSTLHHRALTLSPMLPSPSLPRVYSACSIGRKQRVGQVRAVKARGREAGTGPRGRNRERGGLRGRSSGKVKGRSCNFRLGRRLAAAVFGSFVLPHGSFAVADLEI